MARPESQDITIALKADPSLVATYNATYYDTAEALPENYYTVETPQATIWPVLSFQTTSLSASRT